MDFITEIATYLYANGNLLMTMCRVIGFAFSLETLAYIISLIMGVTKTVCK